MTAYVYERGPGDSDEFLRTSCWCDTRAVLVPVNLVGERTFSCGSRMCRAMNDEYEERMNHAH